MLPLLRHCSRFVVNPVNLGDRPVSILPSSAAGPSRTRLLICRNSSGSSPPTTVKPKPRRLFFSLVLMKLPFSSERFRVKKGFPPEHTKTISRQKDKLKITNSQHFNMKVKGRSSTEDRRVTRQVFLRRPLCVATDRLPLCLI